MPMSTALFPLHIYKEIKKILFKKNAIKNIKKNIKKVGNDNIYIYSIIIAILITYYFLI